MLKFDDAVFHCMVVETQEDRQKDPFWLTIDLGCLLERKQEVLVTVLVVT